MLLSLSKIWILIFVDWAIFEQPVVNVMQPQGVIYVRRIKSAFNFTRKITMKQFIALIATTVALSAFAAEPAKKEEKKADAKPAAAAPAAKPAAPATATPAKSEPAKKDASKADAKSATPAK